MINDDKLSVPYVMYLGMEQIFSLEQLLLRVNSSFGYGIVSRLNRKLMLQPVSCQFSYHCI